MIEKNISQKIIKTVKEFFESVPNIAAVYLFGSFVNPGRIFNDVDVGVLFKYPDIPDLFTVREMQENLADIVKKPVDLVVLNNTSPILKMQVLRKGKLIVNRFPGILNQFIVAAQNEYHDLKIIRKNIEDKLLKVTPID